MSENIKIKTRQKWFGTYHKLAELAQKANIRVVLELLSALRHSKDDLEARDRLNQALTHVLVYWQWRQSQGLEDTCFEHLNNMSGHESPLVKEILTVMASLPLTFATDCHRCHYASLSGKELLDLTEILIAQPTFINNIPPDHNFVIRRYLQVCTELLEICSLNQDGRTGDANGELNHMSVWRNFLLSPSQLGEIPAVYETIKQESQEISLPQIPYFDLGEGKWLLSKEQMTDTILCAYVRLLKQAYGDALCETT